MLEPRRITKLCKNKFSSAIGYSPKMPKESSEHVDPIGKITGSHSFPDRMH